MKRLKNRRHNDYRDICPGCVHEYYEAEIAMILWEEQLPYFYSGRSKETLQWIKDNPGFARVSCGSVSIWDEIDAHMSGLSGENYGISFF